MDFSTKIQKLRNNSKLTQEQLTQTQIFRLNAGL